MSRDSKSKYVYVLLIAAMFIFLVIFFTQIHPLMIYDQDDWANFAKRRSGLPEWGSMNPCKILPEALMSIVSDVGVYLFYDLVHMDLFDSLTAAYALCLSAVICVYVHVFGVVLRRVLHANWNEAVLLQALFFLVHFSIFRSSWNNNVYLFGAYNVTSIFHYVIPAMVNAVTVFVLILQRYDERFCLGTVDKAVLFALFYFSIFSSINESHILIAFLGSGILMDLPSVFKKRQTVVEYAREHAIALILVIVWLVSLVFEINGGSASYREFTLDLVGSASSLISMLHKMNHTTLLVGGVFCVVGLIAALRGRNIVEMLQSDKGGLVLRMIVSMILSTAFLVLLEADVSPRYFQRAEVMFGIMFYAFVIVLLLALEAIQHVHAVKVIAPILAFLVLMTIMDGGRVFRETNTANMNPEICKAVNEDILEQMLTAQENVETSVELHVPTPPAGEGWPHASYVGEDIARGLYQKGILRRQLEATVVYDDGMNERYQVDYQHLGE